MSSQTQTPQQLYKAEADVLAKENATLQAKIEELEAKNKLLQGQVKDAEERTSAALHGKLTELKPFVDDTIRKEVAISSAGLRDRIQNLETELTEVQALNAALTQELQNTLLENENLASYITARKERLGQASDQALLMHNILEYELSEAEGPETKFLKNNAGLRRRFNQSVTKPRVVTQDQALQPSETRTSVPQPKSLAKPKPKTQKTERAEKQGTEKPRATDDQGFTVAGKGRSASAKQGPKQESLSEKAASNNRYAPLSEHEKENDKSVSHAKESVDSRQPSPNPKSVNQAAEKRASKPESASPLPSDRKDQIPVSKTALPVNSEAIIPPESSFNPTAASFAPSPSKSMAQVAADPPKQKVSVSTNFMKSFLREKAAEKSIPESKMPDTKRFVAPVGIEPTTPKPTAKPTASVVAKDTMEHDTPAGTGGPKSPMTKAYPQGRSRPWEAIERQLGKMPEKWSDTLEDDAAVPKPFPVKLRPRESVSPFGVNPVTPDQGAQSAGKASEDIGLSPSVGRGVPLAPKDSPALAKSDPHQSTAQVTTATGNQSEIRLPNPVVGGTLPSTPAATEPSPSPGNTIPGKKKFEDEVMYQPHPNDSGRSKRKKGKKFHTQSELLNQAKASTKKS